MHFPILTALIFVPAAGAALVGLMPSSREDVAKFLGLMVSTATGVMTLIMMVDFATHNAGFQFVTRQNWISDFGISWHLGVDGISLFLVVLTGILFPVALAGPKIHGQPKSF
ncbi:MAG TPA: Fe-S-binding domain-containing protein, partial [Acidimicrobiales bacterium]|nr:Fe-S-binding domain-containing protein [Acidimicrobiales bacterium]